jgi:transposase
MSLIYFLVSQNDPYFYCEEWIANNLENIGPDRLTAQKISILLQKINDSHRNNFLSKWLQFRSEDEYLALDVTSISSFSNLIEDVEYGKNKEDDKLPQINFCMLFGEKSGLPIYFTHYSGSLNDVVTLKPTLQKLDALHNKSYKLVLDKGFASTQNIDSMLYEYPKYKFIISMPITSRYSKLFTEHASDINLEKYSITFNGQVINGKRITYYWDEKKPLNMFLYLNNDIYNDQRCKLYKK